MLMIFTNRFSFQNFILEMLCFFWVSIAAKLVANLITEAGADRVLACDLHSGKSMGPFDIPVDHVHGQPVILDYLASKRK
ncbi:putative ribose-phosphate diphosphokinase [Helianthus annuus]|nr:putative ribose-phosphate diphosphokinase [Helianthus annuus]KAJ0723959.1 putative ribose-phosphate diphosphokinase [Helianthus annuus]